MGQLGSEEQSESGAGLEEQRRALAAACERYGWQPVELVEEAGFSASDRKRPGVEEALRVPERADATALVAAKQVRLSQALLDLASLLAAAQPQGFALVALDCALEPTRPAGEASANLRASFAPASSGCTRNGSGRRSRPSARRASASADPRACPRTRSSGSSASEKPARA